MLQSYQLDLNGGLEGDIEMEDDWDGIYDYKSPIEVF
jgi:hypothetical protein